MRFPLLLLEQWTGMLEAFAMLQEKKLNLEFLSYTYLNDALKELFILPLFIGSFQCH